MVSTPKPDNSMLKDQQKAASLSSVRALQDGLANTQDTALRYYGARRAVTGGAKTSPMVR